MPSIGGFNWVDISILILIGIGLTVGYTQGLMRQVVGLAALYLATILASQYYIPFSNFLRAVFFLQNSRLLNAAAFFVIVLGVSGIINWLVTDAYRVIKIRMFPLLDQFGGAILGFVTVVIALTLLLPVLLFVTVEPIPYFDFVRSGLVQGLQLSRTVPLFLAFKTTLLNGMTPWLPSGLPSIFNL